MRVAPGREQLIASTPFFETLSLEEGKRFEADVELRAYRANAAVRHRGAVADGWLGSSRA